MSVDKTQVHPGEQVTVIVHWYGDVTSPYYPANKGPRADLLTQGGAILDSDHLDIDSSDPARNQTCEGAGKQLTLTVPADLDVNLHPTLRVVGGLWPANDGVNWYCQSGQVTLTLTAPVDLRVDSNNDGTVDLAGSSANCADPNADDCIENQPSLNKGLLLPVNNNDTNTNAILDYREATITGESNDLRSLRFRFPPGATGGTLRLTVEPASGTSRLRVYDDAGAQRLGAPPFDENGEPIGAATTTVSVPFDPGIGDNWYDWLLEGVDKGIVRLRLTYLNAAGQEGGNDVAKVVVYEIRSALPEGGELTPAGATQELPADQPSFYFFTSIEFADENGELLDASTASGSQVQWFLENASGGSALAPAQSAVDARGWTYTTVTADTTPGSTFTLAAKVAALCVQGQCFALPPHYVLEHQGPPIQVVPGEAVILTTRFEDEAGNLVDPPSYPASGVDRLTALLEAFDAVGNPVADNTPVWAELVGDGRIDWASMLDPLVTVNGTATVELVAGLLPDQPGAPSAILGLKVDEPVEIIDIHQLPIDIALTPSAAAIEAKRGQSVQITAQVLASDGSQVADGAEIVWITSLGSLSGQGSVAVTTIQGGQSSIQLSTAATNGLGQPIPGGDVVGTARIIAAIGHSQGRTSVEFMAPSGSGGSRPLHVRAQRRVLAGDATADEEVEIDKLDFESRFEKMSGIAAKLGLTPANCPGCDLSPEDLDGDGSITAADVIKARDQWNPPVPTAPAHASTDIDIHGDPNDRVRVMGGFEAFIYLFGLDEDDELVLDETGWGRITAVSKGQTPDSASFDMLFERVNGAGGPDDIDNLRIKLIPKQDYGVFYNIFAGSVWGGGEGAGAFAADAVVSFLFIGDIRDLLVEGLFSEEPDELVIAFAGIGLTTEFTGLGDVVMTWLKRVAKQLRTYRRLFGMKFGRPIVRIIKDLLTQKRTFAELEAFFKSLIDHRFLKVAMSAGEEGVDDLIRTVNRLGEPWAGYIGKAGTDVSIGGAKKIASVMSTLDDATVNMIRSWPAARQERLAQAIANCRGKVDGGWLRGGIPDEMLTPLLTVDNITALEQAQRAIVGQFPGAAVGNGFDEMMEHLGKVAANGTEGTREFVAEVLRPALRSYAENPVPGNLSNLKGHLNELQRMADIVDGRFADSLGNTRYGLEGTGLYPRPTQGDNINMDAWGKTLDAPTQSVVWELKHGLSPTGKQRKKLIEEITTRAQAASLSGGKVIVELRGAPWSPTLRQELIQIGTRFGVNVEVLP